MMITVLILIAAIGVLGWGFYRARPYGRAGILSWLQSVALIAPWLIFFGLFAAGIYLNLLGILVLLLASTASYIVLGNRLRAEGQILRRSQRFLDFDATSEVKTAESLESNGAKSRLHESDVSATPNSNGGKATESAPISLQRQDAQPPRIADDDLKTIQGIFGIDTFFATETIPYQEGAIFRGNLRGEPDGVYQRLSTSLRERVADSYRLFLVEGPDDKPVIIVLPSSSDPQPTTGVQAGVALLLAIATAATSLETASLLLGFDVSSALSRLGEVVPIAAGILLVLAVHELGHRFLARRYDIRLSPPFFIPTWQIGSFGALTRFESLLPNRTVLFDIAIAGPAAGGLVSLGILIAGLLLSHQGSLFQIPTEFFQGSILVGTLARVILGSELQSPLVAIHPMTMIGWLGLVITAINLMPAGQLDGGRIVQSIYGRTVAKRATVATLIVLGLATLANPLALYWAIVILFLQRDLERPSLNELSEPDDARAALGLLALFLMAAMLLPLTPGLAGRLGIGG